MNIASKTRKFAIMSFAALSMVAAGAATAPDHANANGRVVGALLGGLIVGAAINNAQRSYAQPNYRTCYWQDRVWWDNYGVKHIQPVQVCN